MTAEMLAELLEDLFNAQVDDEPADLDGAQTRSFGETDVLTGNAGFVVTLSDGSAFEITIVKSKHGRGTRCEECGRQITSGEIEAYRLEANDPTAVPSTCDACAEGGSR